MSEQREDERGVVWAVLIGVVLLAIGLAVGIMRVQNCAHRNRSFASILGYCAAGAAGALSHAGKVPARAATNSAGCTI